jgi:hypothetical protein
MCKIIKPILWSDIVTIFPHLVLNKADVLPILFKHTDIYRMNA